MSQEIERPTRPWRLVVLTLVLALFQLGAIVHMARLPGALAGQINLIPPLEMAAASLWVLIFVAVTVNLLRSRTTRLAFWALIGFVTFSTARLFFFVQADYDQTRLPFVVAANILAFVMALFMRR